jgi:hypothetical protein
MGVREHKSIARTEDPEWWDVTTIHSRAAADPRGGGYGILDRDYDDRGPAGPYRRGCCAGVRGTEFIMTFFQPAAFTDAFFDQQIKLIDVELAELKQILEQAVSS